MKIESHDTEATAAHLRGCEEALLDEAVRRDRARIDAYLAEDFEEFGASGRVWTRGEILDELARERYIPITIEDFRCSIIQEGVALVTYRAVRDSGQAGLRVTSLRSSIWTQREGTWKMRFHQGTRIP